LASSRSTSITDDTGVTDAGKALVATGDPLRALVAAEELEKYKAPAEAYRRAQEAMESDAVEEEILCR
jgi:hypothetical protein